MASEMNRISMHPDICGGRPCVLETRVRVKDVLDLLAAGATPEEMLEDFPYLERADISAVLKFAAGYLDHTMLRAAA
jgi:uncharacterized protein (DUF433 family)